MEVEQRCKAVDNLGGRMSQREVEERAGGFVGRSAVAQAADLVQCTIIDRVSLIKKPKTGRRRDGWTENTLAEASQQKGRTSRFLNRYKWVRTV